VAVLEVLVEHRGLALDMVLVLEAGPQDTQATAVLAHQMGELGHYKLEAQEPEEVLVEAVVVTPVVVLGCWGKGLLGWQLRVQMEEVVLVELMGLIQLADYMAEEARAILEVTAATPIILLVQEAQSVLFGPARLANSHQRIQETCNA
jgi:hypothetical protein